MAAEADWVLGSREADMILPLGFAVFFPTARAILNRIMYEPLGRYYMFRNEDGKIIEPEDGEEKIKKWKESCWKLTIYIAFTLLALAVSYDEPWFTDSKYFWVGCTRLPCDLFVSKKLLLFYCVETGFYMQAIPFLIFIETRRKDWWESFAHHIVTLGLMSYSYYLNFTRIGLMVMLVHDVSDIFLEWAKLARYSKRQDLATIHFVIFAITWFVFRVFYFPLRLIRSTLFDSIELAAKPHNIQAEPHYTIFNGMLITLFVLHVYWSWLIIKVIITQLTGGEARDVREKDD